MQNKEKEKQQNRDRIKRRIRKVVSGTPERPRLVVFRANANISTQLVDDVNHKTLATVTSVAKKYDDIKQKSNGKIEISKKIGLDTAEVARNLNISAVVFDRNGCRYHGRIKAVADGAREGGLKF